MRLLEDNLGKKSMVEPATLTDFIRYIESNFPVDRYLLIFWDHGGGSVTGYGYDEHFKGDHMTLDGIERALFNAGTQLDFIGFDACLMATLETDFVVEPYADYLIASEELEPGIGWYYTGWPNELSQNSSVETIELGKKLIDDYVLEVKRQTPNDWNIENLAITNLNYLMSYKIIDIYGNSYWTPAITNYRKEDLMIQDIRPRIFNNKFTNKKAEPKDLFLSYKEETVLVKEEKDKLWYPSFADFQDTHPALKNEAQFLFNIDEINYFLVKQQDLDTVKGWTYVTTGRFRTELKYWRSFAGTVGWQLNRWYQNHNFCSRCGHQMKSSENERMLYCEGCGFQTYPVISPCVIVAVHEGDRLLLTKYAGRSYKNFALIAGFVEIGESLEETVQREVMEEVGLKVKNIQFYKSQPWPFTDTILAGFFAELDGDDKIIIDEDELSMGVWMDRDKVPPDESRISLTGEMMEAFRTKRMP